MRVEGENLSYGALSAWSAQIANALLRYGAGAESRVGLCVERGLALPAALLGILRSGAAYVPLDPGYPEARLSAMLEDAGIDLVVADPASTARLGPLLAGRKLVLTDAVGTESSDDPALPVHPDQAAYIIYTYGLDGRPQGASSSPTARPACISTTSWPPTASMPTA